LSGLYRQSSRFPPGVLNCVPALGANGGAALAEHADVDKVYTFIAL
jgi:acyl-CoA reductase-like NAD-dependent aldehyde dehydrogenase